MLVVLNNTLINSTLASDVPYNASSNTPPRKHIFRRYLELQAAAWHSWVCRNNSPQVAAIGSQAAAEGVIHAPTAAGGIGPDFILMDAADIAEAVSANNISSQSAAGMLWANGCQYLESFVLVDVKWALQAQVSRTQGRSNECCSTALPVSADRSEDSCQDGTTFSHLDRPSHASHVMP